jgi:hypothetical protein
MEGASARSGGGAPESAGAEGLISFDPAVVQQVLESSFKAPGTQVEPRAVQMSAEVMRMFVVEAVHRAADQAQQDEGPDAAMGPAVEIGAEHILRILPQLLLDFS